MRQALWRGFAPLRWRLGWNDPWYNYRVGTLVHASKELNVYNALPTLFLSNDHTGSSELCTLFLDPEWRKEGNGYLLSKSRFMFMAAFRDKFNDKVVAEMRGVIDEHGYSPFWQSLGKRFFSMDFSRADFLCGTGQKAFIAELMPKHPDLYPLFIPGSPGRHRSGTSANRACSVRCWRKKVFATVTISTSLTAGRHLNVISTACAPSVKVGWGKWPKGSLRRAIFRPAWSPMKIFASPLRPKVCAGLQPSTEMCGQTTHQAMVYLIELEALGPHLKRL